MSVAGELYRLQKLDQETDSKHRRLIEVLSAIQDSQAVRAAQQRLSTASARAMQRTVHQTDLELKLQGLIDKSNRETERLYGGSVRNPKELEDLQGEIASLRRRQARLEDDLLQAMIDSEEANAVLETARDDLAAAETSMSERQMELGAEQAALSQRIANLARERTAVTVRIGAGDIASYEALRKRKGGFAVAGVVGDACSACGVAVSSNRKWHIREGELVHCANCERIIVLV